MPESEKYEPQNPYGPPNLDTFSEGRTAQVYRADFGLRDLDRLLTERFDRGFSDGQDLGRGDRREAQRVAFEQGVAMACVIVHRASDKDRSAVLGAIEEVDQVKDPPQPLLDALRRLLDRIEERIEWAENRPALGGAR